MSLKEAKNADQSIKDVVFGFIKESTEESIPMMINYVCLLYYLMSDKFASSLAAQGIKISSNGKCNNVATRINNLDGSKQWMMAYGDRLIDLVVSDYSVIEWTLKMYARDAAVGICHSTYSGCWTDGFINYASDGRAAEGLRIVPLFGTSIDQIYSGYQRKQTQCEHYGLSDVIKIKLNIKTKTVSFYKTKRNIDSFICKFDAKEPKYRLAVGLRADTFGRQPSIHIINVQFKI